MCEWTVWPDGYDQTERSERTACAWRADGGWTDSTSRLNGLYERKGSGLSWLNARFGQMAWMNGRYLNGPNLNLNGWFEWTVWTDNLRGRCLNGVEGWFGLTVWTNRRAVWKDEWTGGVNEWTVKLSFVPGWPVHVYRASVSIRIVPASETKWPAGESYTPFQNSDKGTHRCMFYANVPLFIMNPYLTHMAISLHSHATRELTNSIWNVDVRKGGLQWRQREED